MTDIHDLFDLSMVKALVKGMTQEEFVTEYVTQRDAYIKKYTDNQIDIKKACRPVDLGVEKNVDEPIDNKTE